MEDNERTEWLQLTTHVRMWKDCGNWFVMMGDEVYNNSRGSKCRQRNFKLDLD
jgi:hypothetical protein